VSVLRFFALALIFGAVSTAWMLLGASTYIRTEMLDDSLSGEMDSLWGPEMLAQAAPYIGPARDGDNDRADTAAAGLRSLFIGFETLNQATLRGMNKGQNLTRDYGEAIRRLRGLDVMVNASFVFGMDGDDESVFDRTVEWAIDRGIETATFHILTPYPGTVLHSRLAAQGRILSRDWDLYDTRHAVFQPARMSPEALEAGYRRAYREFYRWSSILRSARATGSSHLRPNPAAAAAGQTSSAQSGRGSHVPARGAALAHASVAGARSHSHSPPPPGETNSRTT